MVLRAILRNVQNTLILSSVLLVILALQRLQHYEFPHQFSNGNAGFGMDEEQEQQEHHVQFGGSGGNSIEQNESPIVSLFGSRHHVVLGREFHVGLFRFFLPRLERTDDSEKEARKQEWEVVGTATLIHYVVDFLGSNNATESKMNVCDAATLDAATVLHHSLEKKKVLHAIVDDSTENTLSCNATAILTKIGYHVVPSSSIRPTASKQQRCSLDQPLWQTFAVQKLKHVDVVVHLPVTAIANQVVPTEQSAARRRERRRALSSSVYSSSQSIQLLRPKQLSSCTIFTPTVCHASPCQISRRVALLVPPPRRKKCHLPWSCDNENNGTTSSACRIYHHLWTQTRNEVATSNAALCQDGKYVPMRNYY